MSTTAPAPRWGTPIDPDRDITPAGLQAGDEVGPAPAPVDQHLVVPVAVPRRVAPPRSLDDVRDTVRATLRHSPMLAAWALLGFGVALKRVGQWWWDADGHPMLGTIVAESDKAYTIMAQKRAERQRYRAMVIGGGILTALSAIGVLYATARWALLPLTAAALAYLAWLGKPADARMIVTPTVTTTGAPRLTSGLIVSALCSLGISPLTRALEKDSTRIWRSSIAVVDGGYRAHIQLPDAVTADQLLPKEQALASALGRPADTVIVEPLPDISPGDANLWILNRSRLTSDRGPGPLGTAKRASWWQPVVLGVTRTGQKHTEPLRGGAWFVGGRPSSGKSSLCRIAAAQTALDPGALLIVVNLKGSPDYLALKPVCHRYLSGAPETDPHILAETTALLRWLLAECGRRNDLLVRLHEQGRTASNDVTAEVAKAHPQLAPMTVILDEVHRLIDRSDNPEADAAAELLAKAIKAVRSVAITLICATQLAGVDSIPPAITRAARLRGCLTVSDSVSFGQIFGNAGQGAFASSGVSTLAPGSVLLRSETGSPVKVGCYNLTPAVLRQIGQRALTLRTATASLTGEAAGQEVHGIEESDPTELLRDLLDVIPTTPPVGGERDGAVAWLSELEPVLAERRPVYADRAEGWLSGELKARRVLTNKVVRRGPDGQRGQVGVTATAVRSVLRDLVAAAQDDDEVDPAAR